MKLKIAKSEVKCLKRIEVVGATSLLMEADTKMAIIGSREVKLTGQEFYVLWFLYVNKNKIVNRDEIIRSMPKTSSRVPHNLLNVIVCKLRRKLRDAPECRFNLQTVWGRGYVLIEGDGTLAE